MTILKRYVTNHEIFMEEPIYGWGLPLNISTYGQAIDDMIILVHWFMALLFIGWGIYLIYALIRFRQRPGHKASYESAHSRVPKLVEIGVVVFEIFLLVGLSFPVWNAYRTEFPPKEEALEIRVIAQQFVWNIHYPGRDNLFGKTDSALITDVNSLGLDESDPAGKDDIITLNQLHFPVNKPVIANITSKDVIHSFSIPVLRVKQDAVPGMVVPVWFEATKTGQFEIQCAQLCGVGHTMMRGFVSIDTDEEFETWFREQESFLAPAQNEGSS